jgi:hypothetical protein
MDETHKAGFTTAENARPGTLEKLLWRKQSYLIAAFFDQGAYPMKHSRLGLLLADLHRRVKLIVKRNIGWGGGDSQSATVLR